MSRKIMLVEDEAISAMALKLTVERVGCEVVASVDTGEAALAQAAARRPDLVLMDTRLRTAMSGVEAANLLWERHRIPCVFISAYNAAELEADYRGAEPFLLLVKPVLDEELEGVISGIFETDRQPPEQA